MNVTLAARTERTVPGGVVGPIILTISITAGSPIYAFVTPTGRWLKVQPNSSNTLALVAGESVSGVIGFENQTIMVTVL